MPRRLRGPRRSPRLPADALLAEGLVGLGIISALILAATGTAPFWGAGPTWQLGFFYLLAFGDTILGCVAARASAGPFGWVRGIAIAQVYAPYTWLIWPVLLRSSWRQMRSRGGWAKTEREPLEPSAVGMAGAESPTGRGSARGF